MFITKGHIYTVLGSQLRERILHATHDSPLSGHQGFLKTYKIVRERFSQKGLKGDVLRHVHECEACQRNKGELTHPTGLLQQLPIRESISMDFITGLPISQRGHDSIWVIVDRLTKVAHFLSIRMDFKTLQYARLFIA